MVCSHALVSMRLLIALTLTLSLCLCDRGVTLAGVEGGASHVISGGHATEEFAVHLHEDSDPLVVARELGLEYIKQIGTLKCHHLFRARDSDHAAIAHEVLSSHSSIKWYERQVLRKRYSRTPVDGLSFDGKVGGYGSVNLDPLQSQNTQQSRNVTHTLATRKPSAPWDGDGTWKDWTPSDPLFSKQWHLFETTQSDGGELIGMNVVSAWPLATGLGVCVAIVDDGVLHLHKDLKDKYSESNSYNFNSDNTNILPQPGDPHGTMCAGAATAATNDVCGVGVAFRANISGLRILGGSSHDAMEAAALTFNYHSNHVFSNSWGPTDDGQTLEGPGPLTLAALEDGVRRGRHGLGSIYVWAVGNGATRGDNCNYDGYASSRFVLTVASVDFLGHHPYYSELCAAIIISAPSTGSVNNIITTNMHYECDLKFSGTSASAPLVAGVVALMLEANPNLTWRDVHHVIINTARRNDIHDFDWVLNAANRYVNHKYGFGIVDAHAAVLAAKTWRTVPLEVSVVGPVVQVEKPIPESFEDGVISTVQIHDNIKLEHVEVVFTATHPIRTDLRVVLYSPAGTPSYLSELHGTSAGYVLKVQFAQETVQCKIVNSKFGISPTAWLDQTASAPLVLVNESACAPHTHPTPINQTIVVIPLESDDRCSWTTKAKLAQEEGALVVLVASPNKAPFELPGYDSSVVIPVLLIGQVESARILSELTNPPSPPPSPPSPSPSPLPSPSSANTSLPLPTASPTPQPLSATVTTAITTKNTQINFQDWVFSTVHLWDEESRGTWSLEVYDMHSSGTGVFNRWQLRLHGTNISDSPVSSSMSSMGSSTTSVTGEASGDSSGARVNSSGSSVDDSFLDSSVSFINSLDRNMSLVVIVLLTTAAVVGWYMIERRGRARTAPQTANTLV